MFTNFSKLLVKCFGNQGVDKRLPFLVGLFKRFYSFVSPDKEFIVGIPLNSKLCVSGKDSGLGLFLRVNKTFEPIQTKKFINTVKKSDVVFDIGANVGYYTVLASKLVGENGKVFAFEPDPRNLKLLKKNVELNGCKNVEIVGMAVGKEKGTAFLKTDKANFGETAISNNGNIKVETVSLDGFCAQRKIFQIDVLKIDVEGAELAVLSGAKKLFEKNKEINLFIECNPKSLKTHSFDEKSLIIRLQNLGFSLKEIISENLNKTFSFNKINLEKSLQSSGFVGIYGCKKGNAELSKNPLVTVLMTAFNAEKFIKESLDSIVKQTYENLEIIVVDDGSTDNTLKIIQNLQKTDKRIKVFQMKENNGPSLASNFGIKKANGEFIARMDADDISYPDRIEKQVKFLRENPNVVLLGGQCILINEKSEVIGKKTFPTKHEDIYKKLFSVNPIQHPSCIVNMALVPKNKFVYGNHSVLAHDLELVFSLSRYGNLANLDDTILYYRQYGTSLSLKNPKKTFRATIEIREKAVRQYGYKPRFTGKVVNIIQKVLVGILPEKYIYSIFMFLRGARKLGFSDIKKLFYIPKPSPKSSILVLSK